MSRTFLALLQFDGGAFVGWQRQREGRTVQGEFERVLTRLTGAPAVAHAAGRTDAGVHALGLGVSFSMPERWDAAAVRRAYNALLPADCWVAGVGRMREGFHARKCAAARRYWYDVGTDADAWSPFRRRYEWALDQALDAGRLVEAAEGLEGEHDFVAFAAKGTPQAHFRCHLHTARWEPRADGAGYRFVVEGNRFLMHMVRMLVGTMIDIGVGRRAVGDMRRLLTSSDNSQTSPPAPPHGLFFVSAQYPATWYLEDSA